MRCIYFLLLLMFFVSCGDSGKTSGSVTSKQSEDTVKEHDNEVELSKDEELVLNYFKEKSNQTLDALQIGYDVAKILKRDIRNVDALLLSVDLIKYDLTKVEIIKKMKIEIKKI